MSPVELRILREIQQNQRGRARSDLPDVLGYADVLAAPEVAEQVLERRQAQGTVLGRPRRFAYPKPSGAEHRQFVSLDPYADLAYRRIVGRAVGRIEAQLGKEVLSSRSVLVPHTWRIRDVGAAFEERREATARGRLIWPNGGELTMDVQSHYPSIHWDNLSRLLSSVGCADGLVAIVLDLARGVSRIDGMPQGLPIGPEGSAPLGTLALLPVDRLLRRMGLPFVRWVDDVTVWVPDEDVGNEVLAAVEELIALSSQGLNKAKTSYAPLVSGEVLWGEFDPWLSGAEDFGDAVGDDASENYLAALIDDPHQVADLPKWLGQLRRLDKPTAIRPVLDAPWVAFRFPRQVGQYLRYFASSVPWGEVKDLVLAEEPNEETAGGLLHVLHAVPAQEVDATTGERLFDRALGLDEHKYAPLRNLMLKAASDSKEPSKVRRHRAREVLDVTSDLNAQRALLVAFASGGLGGRWRRELARQAQLNPDLAPTVDWVLAS